jgi:adenosylmethionine-8-amino-7-oxononanoate aminotransferase
MWIEDTNGTRYMDMGGGALVVNVGHGREEIVQAVSEQMSRFSRDPVHFRASRRAR